MIGIILVTHHDLARSLLDTAAQVIGPIDHAVAISIGRADDADKVKKQLQNYIKAMRQQGMPVLILTDMFGGTPSNISLSLYDPGRVEIITGINLPMLLKLAQERNRASLAEVTELLTEYGRKNIFSAAEFLN
jgi:PTS system mannose-specific IIA component